MISARITQMRQLSRWRRRSLVYGDRVVAAYLAGRNLVAGARRRKTGDDDEGETLSFCVRSLIQFRH